MLMVNDNEYTTINWLKSVDNKLNLINDKLDKQNEVLDNKIGMTNTKVNHIIIVLIGMLFLIMGSNPDIIQTIIRIMATL